LTGAKKLETVGKPRREIDARIGVPDRKSEITNRKS
jgi:hypothetical protein